jgi:hypothetical protein
MATERSKSIMNGKLAKIFSPTISFELLELLSPNDAIVTLTARSRRKYHFQMIVEPNTAYIIAFNDLKIELGRFEQISSKIKKTKFKRKPDFWENILNFG